MKKKALSLSLSIVMLVSIMLVYGCSSSGATSSLAPATSAAVTATSSSANSGNITWDTADLSWKKHTDPVTLSAYLNFNWYPVDTWGKDDVSKEITKMTGISLNVTKGSDPAQILVMLASGSLPDIIFTDDQVQRYCTDQVSYAWDDLINKHCPEFMQLIPDDLKLVNTQDNGHFYTLKTHFVSSSDWNNPNRVPSFGDPSLAIRTDILQSIGIDLKSITSVEALGDAFAAVQAKYPKMIPWLPQQVWPIVIQEDFIGQSFNPSAGGMQSYVTPDGTIKLFLEHPNMKDYMLLMNDWYLKGYFPKEYSTYKTDQFMQQGDSGNVFAMSYNIGITDALNQDFKKNGTTGTWAVVNPPLTWKGQNLASPVLASTGWASCFISKNCSNPERAIDFMEFLRSPYGQNMAQWGIEGTHYTLDDQGLPIPTSFQLGETTAQSGVGPWVFQGSQIAEAMGMLASAKTTSPYVGEVAKARAKIYTLNLPLAFAIPDAGSDEYTIESKIDDLWATQSLAIFTASSQSAASSLFDQMMSQAKSYGLDKLDATLQSKYEAAVKKFAPILTTSSK